MLWGHRAPLLMRIYNTWNYIEVLTSSHSTLECDMIRSTSIKLLSFSKVLTFTPVQPCKQGLLYWRMIEDNSIRKTSECNSNRPEKTG